MIVGDLDVIRVALFPSKADPPSVVDPNAVLALAIPFERLQAVSRWRHQVLQRSCPMEIEQLASGLPLDAVEAWNRDVVK